MTTTWRKSSYSAGSNNCVELATTSDTALLRDSKHPNEGHLTLTRTELAALIRSAAAGELDDLAN